MDPAPFPELNGMEYVLLSVSPRGPPLHSPPPWGCAAAFVFMAPPFCWLDIGTPVHLHLDPSPRLSSGPCRCARTKLRPDELAVRGWVVAERARTDWTVEYVVKNEDPNTTIHHISIQFGPIPGIIPPPRANVAAARRTYMRAEQTPKLDERAHGPGGPHERLSREHYGGPVTRGPQTRGDGPENWTGPREKQVLGCAGSGSMTMNMAPPRVPRTAGVLAMHPYATWETYGNAAISRSAKDEADGIRNYGCPIVVRPRERRDGAVA